MLTLMWVIFLGVRFEMEGWGKITPCIKLVTDPYLSSKCMSFSTKALLILLMSAFFCKKSAIFGQNSTFTLCNSVRAVLKIF